MRSDQAREQTFIKNLSVPNRGWQPDLRATRRINLAASLFSLRTHFKTQNEHRLAGKPTRLRTCRRRRQAGRERGMPGGPIPSRHSAAPMAFSCQTLRVADLLGGEQRCRRGASPFEDCSLGWVRGLTATCTTALLL